MNNLAGRLTFPPCVARMLVLPLYFSGAGKGGTSMNRWKRMCAALAAAALLAGLTACQSGSVTDNANTYVQGLLDANYLGEISTDYLKVTEYADREAAEADYEAYMAQEAEDLLSYLIVSKPTQAVTQRAQEVIRAIYSHAQYTVAPAEELESGDVTVSVTISPIEFPSLLSDEALLEIRDQIPGPQ